MEFIANREVLLPALSKVIGVVERRHTLPILGNLLVVVREGMVTVTGTDLEVEVITDFEADIYQEGETTVPARKLVDICRNLSENAPIRLKLKDDRCVVTSGRGRFSLGVLPATDYPTMDRDADGIDLTLREDLLKRLLDKTAFAMAQQDVRYYLNGLLVEISNSGITAVATDGHRLAKFVCAIETGVEGERQIIIPNKTVMELRRQLSASDNNILFCLGSKSLRIDAGRLTLTTKLVDGRYPDYERVIPSQIGRFAEIDKDALKRALSRAAILTNEKFRGVRLSFEPGLLKLLAHNPEQDEAQEEVEIHYDGDNISIGFNISYLMDVLGAIDGEILSVQFQDGSNSSIWRGRGEQSETFVVMPMRI